MTSSSDRVPDDGRLTARRTKVVVGAILALGVAAALALGGWLLARRLGVLVEDLEEPVYGPGEEDLDGADLALVHQELLPTWHAAQTMAHMDPDGADEAFEHLLAELEPVPRLVELLEEYRALYSAPGDEAARRREGIVDEYNRHLAQRGKPWAIALPPITGGYSVTAYTLSYYIDARVDVKAGDRTIPVSLATRVDNLNVVEGYLGLARLDESEPLVVVDRVAELGADRIWPLMDPQLDREQTSMHGVFARRVREETTTGVGTEALAPLVLTARARLDLVMVKDGINDRHARCGSSTFVMYAIPLRGFSPRETNRWASSGSERGASRCPSITFDEIATVRDASHVLRNAPGLRPAMTALTSLMARSVTVHEVRHVLDGGPPRCPRCPGWLSDVALMEVSAYLAEMSTSGAPYSSMLDVCHVNIEGSRSYRKAARFLIERLLDGGCEGPLPDDLASRATVLEQELFGRTSDISLPADFPASIRAKQF